MHLLQCSMEARVQLFGSQLGSARGIALAGLGVLLGFSWWRRRASSLALFISSCISSAVSWVLRRAQYGWRVAKTEGKISLFSEDSPYLSGWNASNLVKLRWKVEYGPNNSQWLAFLVFSPCRNKFSMGIVLLCIRMILGQIGCPARSSRGRPFLHHIGVGLLPRWALSQSLQPQRGWWEKSSCC